MDKEAALLVVAKDLFLKAWELQPRSKRIPTGVINENGEVKYFAEQFQTFHEKLKSGILRD